MIEPTHGWTQTCLGNEVFRRVSTSSALKLTGLGVTIPTLVTEVN